MASLNVPEEHGRRKNLDLEQKNVRKDVKEITGIQHIIVSVETNPHFLACFVNARKHERCKFNSK